MKFGEREFEASRENAIPERYVSKKMEVDSYGRHPIERHGCLNKSLPLEMYNDFGKFRVKIF